MGSSLSLHNQTLTAPTPKVERDRWGRPLVKPVEGGKQVPYRRCTKYIAVLEDRYLLERWQQRQVATGLAARPDLVLKAASAAGDKTTLDQVTDAAQEAAKSSAAATTGTALHAITEQLDRGQEVVVPPGFQPDLDAYRQATTDLTMTELEVFVVNDQLKVGGTFDRIVEHAGRRYIADIKTGRIDYAYAEISMQLAIYAGARRYRPDTGTREDLGVERDWGLVIHLPAGAGECTVWWCNLAEGRQGVEIARQVWAWRDRRHAFARKFLPLTVQVEQADSVDLLEHLWTRHRAVWTDELTAAAAARKQQLLAHGVRAGEQEGALA